MVDEEVVARELFIAILKLGKMRYCTKCSHFTHDSFSDCRDHLLIRSATEIIAMSECHVPDVIQIITTHPSIRFGMEKNIMHIKVVRSRVLE